MFKNKKGATIVELVVSASLLFIIVTFLFQTIISLKEVYNTAGVKTELLNKQAVISRIINNDFKNKRLEMASDCSTNLEKRNCISFYFEDGTQKTLEIIDKTDTTPAYITYGNYKTELVKGSNFGEYHIKVEDNLGAISTANNSILNIDIPITHPQLSGENYGINILYQYNNKITSITDLAIDGNTGISEIYLVGSSNMVWYSSIPFEDPGYFYLDQNKNLVKAKNTTDAVTVIKEEDLANHKIKLTYRPNSGNTSPIERNVTLIESVYNYSLTNNGVEFTAPVSGTYTIKLWGADGNNTSIATGGIGSYTSGEINLKANEKIYVYVGGTGSGDQGGYNGGGSLTANQSAADGAAGGGATDVRLIGGSWDSKDGLASRIMVAAGGGGASNSTCGYSLRNGGNGGDIISEPLVTQSNTNPIVSCSDYAYTLAFGATQTEGGKLRTYNPGAVTENGTYFAGKFGMAGIAREYTGDIRAGGGGGYYGGASAGYGSFATGGSSFVSGCDNCVAVNINGEIVNSNIHYSGKRFNNISILKGSDAQTVEKPENTNNGYAQITLTSLSYGG